MDLSRCLMGAVRIHSFWVQRLTEGLERESWGRGGPASSSFPSGSGDASRTKVIR